jgi:hypothetical protein
MSANETATSSVGDFVEVSFPAWPTPAWAAKAVALTAPHVWAKQREAVKSAAIVGALVGVPAVIAAGAALALFVLTTFVLLAPLVAAGLIWIAWRSHWVAHEIPPSSPSSRGDQGGARA